MDTGEVDSRRMVLVPEPEIEALRALQREFK